MMSVKDQEHEVDHLLELPAFLVPCRENAWSGKLEPAEHDQWMVSARLGARRYLFNEKGSQDLC